MYCKNIYKFTNLSCFEIIVGFVRDNANLNQLILIISLTFKLLYAYNEKHVGQRPSVGLDDGMCENFKMVINCIFRNISKKNQV